MSDSWLDRGHGDGHSLTPVSSVQAPEVGATEARHPGAWRSRSGRVAVVTVTVVALIGSAGTAYAIRETLFPTPGDATSRSVWQNPVPPDEPVPTLITSTTSSTSTTTTTTSTTLPAAAPSTSQATNTPPIGVPPSTGPDDPGGSRHDSGSSGHGSDDSGSDDSVVSGADDSGSSGRGSDDSGSDDSKGSGSGRSGSDDSSGSGSGGSPDEPDD